MITVAQYENKIERLNRGASAERLIQAAVKRLGLCINRHDQKDLTNPDFIVRIPFDVKYRGVPFYEAEQHTGLKPENAIVVDQRQLNTYRNKGFFIVLFVVEYRDFNLSKILWISSQKILKILESNPQRRYRAKNSITDTQDKFYISVEECAEIPEAFDFVFADVEDGVRPEGRGLSDS